MSAFYHGLTKKIIVGFGSMFHDIHVIRRKGDTIVGDIVQDIRVPIAYGPRDSWFEALEGNPSRMKETKVTLPRMSYEMTGLTYDTQRKLTRSSGIMCVSEDGAEVVSTPAPWNYEFSLYITANNQEDIFQIVEQILPLFNPDYTIWIKMIPNLNITQAVPFSLNSVSMEDNYESGYEQRLVTWTLTFTAKANLYGEVRSEPAVLDVTSGFNEEPDNVVYKAEYEDGTVSIKWNTISGEIHVLGNGSGDYGGPKVLVRENIEQKKLGPQEGWSTGFVEP